MYQVLFHVLSYNDARWGGRKEAQTRQNTAPYREILEWNFICWADYNTSLLESVLCDFSKRIYFYSLWIQRAKVDQRNNSAESSVVIQWVHWGYLQEHESGVTSKNTWVTGKSIKASPVPEWATAHKTASLECPMQAMGSYTTRGSPVPASFQPWLIACVT